MAQYELNLRDYYRIFRKRFVTVLLVFCATMGVSYYRLSTQKPTYQSSIKVKVSIQTYMTSGEAALAGVGDFLQTQLALIESYPVAEGTAKILGWLEGVSDPLERTRLIRTVQKSVKAERIGETSILRVTATSPDPEKPLLIAEAIAEAYRVYDLEERGRYLRATRLFVEEELKKVTEGLKKSEEAVKQFRENIPYDAVQAVQLRNEVTTLELRLQELLLRATPRHPGVERLRRQLAATKGELKGLAQEELTLSRLIQEVGDNQNLVTKLKLKRNDARIRESENVSVVSILEKATPASMSFRSDPKISLVLGAITGLLLGFVCAFFKEGLDTSIGAIEEVESFLGVSVLGVIPHMVLRSERKKLFFLRKIVNPEDKILESRMRLVTHLDPRSPDAESYHTLRTAIYSVLPQKEKLAVAISSTGPREGKSITSANLAVSSARMGKKTLLIDADFRRPIIHDIFGLERVPGLFEVLTKTVPYDQALKNVSDLLIGNVAWQETLRSPHLGYLSFMTAGHLPANPPELLNSQAMEELIRILLAEFDFLIFDCPPILPVTDTLILAPKLDGVILVYQSGRTARNALKRAKMQLDTAQAKLLGVVFNDVRPIEANTSSSYYYRYRKYYTDEDKKGGKDTAE